MQPVMQPDEHDIICRPAYVNTPDFRGVGKSFREAPSTFEERLAFARWARMLTSAAPEESDQDLARRAGVSQPWLAKWKRRNDAPPGHKELAGLAEALGCSWEWLAARPGAAPPLPALWRDWLAARRGKPVAASDPRYVTGELDMIDPERDRGLTPDEIARALKVAEADAPARRGRGA